jgi:hypothetical protein
VLQTTHRCAVAADITCNTNETSEEFARHAGKGNSWIKTISAWDLEWRQEERKPMFHEVGVKAKAENAPRIGVCPYCHGVDGYYNYGPNHYFVCFKHKVRWFASYDLFSTWRKETTDDWINNRQRFEGYEAVVPAPERKTRLSRVYNYIKLSPTYEWI